MIEIDTMQLNLCMESAYVKELLEVKWLYESGLVENIERVVEEYRHSRNLLVGMKGKTHSIIGKGRMGEMCYIKGKYMNPS